jgi:murein DD-endopeptidase MepM/ murein hydrolase activator NlpD
MTRQSRLAVGTATILMAGLIGAILPAVSGPPAAHAAAVAVAPTHTERAAPQVLEIGAGDTLIEVLTRAGIAREEALAVASVLKPRLDPRALRQGQRIAIQFSTAKTKDRHLATLSLEMGSGRYLELTRNAKGAFNARETRKALAAHSVKPAKTQVNKPIAAAANRSPATHVEKTASVNKPVLVTKSGPVTKDARQTLTVRPGDTLASILHAKEIDQSDTEQAISALKPRFDVRQLKAGQEIEVLATPRHAGHKALTMLAVKSTDGALIEVRRQASGKFEIARKPSDVKRTKERAAERDTAARDTDEELDEVDSESASFVEESAPPREAARWVTVLHGDTIVDLLLRDGIDPSEADAALRVLRKIYNPRRLQDGQRVALHTDTGSAGEVHLAAFSIEMSERRYVDVSRDSGSGFKGAFLRKPSFAALIVEDTPPVAEAHDENGQTETRAAPIAGQAVAPEPASVGTETARAASDANTQAADDAAPIDLIAENREGWSVLAWLTGIGHAVSRAGEAAASVLDAEPSHKKARPLNLGDVVADAAISDPYIYREAVFGKGDTLMNVLTAAGSEQTDAAAVVNAFSSAHNPRKLQVGQALRLAFLPISGSQSEGAIKAHGTLQLTHVALSLSPDRDFWVERQNDGSYAPREIDRPLLRNTYRVEAEIRSSLYDASVAAGLPGDVFALLVQIFSYDVDFQRGIQPGDRFEVLYEQVENDRGETIERANVLFAALTVSGERIELYAYEPSDGPPDYFTPDGRSVRKALLKTPIDGARITSGFGMRKHPIMGYSMKHKGVDFAAPSGTPIYAAGDGVIDRIGAYAAYGKYVRIRHDDTFKTAYAHLRGYANGMRVGARVRQGQVIGYVGITGRSTGPHLHFEVLKSDEQVNPTTVRMPNARTLVGKELVKLHTTVARARSLYADARAVSKQIASRACGQNDSNANNC